MVKVIVLSHYLFDEEMIKMHLNDENVEQTKMAFISIIGTKECIEYWIQENDKHYFKDHPNVLNLDFDDIEDDVLYNGHKFQTMNMEQAEEAVNFIETMLDKVDTFFIHCKAGMSRSRAFGEFIYRICIERDIEIVYEDRDDYTTVLNHGVLRRLNHAYWKKHHIRGYEEEGAEYPKDLTNPQLRVINRPYKHRK